MALSEGEWTGAASIRVESTAEDPFGAVVTATVNGTVVALPYTVAAEGSTTIQLVAVDPFGNTARKALILNIDRTAPTVTAEALVGDILSVDASGITRMIRCGALDDSLGADTVTASLVGEGQPSFHTEACEGGFIVTYPLGCEAVLAITATDVAGNSGLTYFVLPVFERTGVASGTLGYDTVWTGTVTVLGQFVVPAGKKLSIAEDAVILFEAGAALRVYGELEVRAGAKLKGEIGASWRGVVVFGQATMQGATVEGADRGVAVGVVEGVAPVRGTLVAAGCSFVSCGIGVHVVSGKATLSACVFANATEYGIKGEYGAWATVVLADGTTWITTIVIAAPCSFSGCTVDAYEY